MSVAVDTALIDNSKPTTYGATKSNDIPILHSQHEDSFREQFEKSSTSLRTLVVCLCTGSFLAAVDSSIVSTIFNDIGTEFQSANLSAWIFTSYLLSSSALQPLYAKLSDVFGRKSILVLVVSFFFVGSWFCGAARTMIELSIARAVAGLGGGGLMCMASVVIHDLIPMRQRGQYQSYVNMTQMVGTAIGAPAGGWINDTLGWRYCFYINLPPCMAILYIYIKRLNNYNLKKSNDQEEKWWTKLDFVGAFILLVANVSFVTGTSFGGNTRDWDDPMIVSVLVLAGLAFFAFFVYEFRRAKHPLLSPALVRDRNVIGSCASNYFLWGTTMAISYLMPQFFMGVLGYTSSSAALWNLPKTIMVAIGCWSVGRYMTVTGRYYRYLVIVLALDVLSLLSMVFWTPDTPLAIELAGITIEGFGFGTVIVSTMVALVAHISHQDTASATSMIFLFRSTGFVSGTAITAAIVQSSFKSFLTKNITGPEAEKIIEFVRTSISKIRTLSPELQQTVIDALYMSLQRGFIYAFLCTALSFIAVASMKNYKLPSAQ